MRALAFALALTASGAGATVLDPLCMLDRETFRLEPSDPVADLDRYAPVYPTREAEGFVSFNWIGPSRGWMTSLLQHCASTQSLIFAYHEPEGGPYTVFERYRELIDSAQGYTFRQIGESLAEVGAQVRISTDDIGSCACDVFDF